MRLILIDAEKLKKSLPKYADYYEALAWIDEAEEVEAIPIEWIEEWLDKITGTRDGEDISQLPEQLKFAIEMINLMEMEWVKENGAEESVRNI